MPAHAPGIGRQGRQRAGDVVGIGIGRRHAEHEDAEGQDVQVDDGGADDAVDDAPVHADVHGARLARQYGVAHVDHRAQAGMSMSRISGLRRRPPVRTRRSHRAETTASGIPGHEGVGQDVALARGHQYVAHALDAQVLVDARLDGRRIVGEQQVHAGAGDGPGDGQALALELAGHALAQDVGRVQRRDGGDEPEGQDHEAQGALEQPGEDHLRHRVKSRSGTRRPCAR